MFVLWRIFGVGLMSGAELEKWKDRSVFTTGVMVFKNCEVIRDLFGRIKADIVERPVFTKCYDQPYIIYHCLLGELYDNQLLNKYVVNRNSEVRTAHLVFLQSMRSFCILIRMLL